MNKSLSKKRHIEKSNIILEQKFIEEQFDVSKTLGFGGIDLLMKRIDYFQNQIEPWIESKAQKLFPYKNLDQQSQGYKKNKDKGDAFRHQLGSAISGKLFGGSIAWVLGQINELRGSWRVFSKGVPSKGIKPFKKISSGYIEDTANNNLGIEIYKKYPNSDNEFYAKEVQRNINNKNYYEPGGKKPT